MILTACAHHDSPFMVATASDARHTAAAMWDSYPATTAEIAAYTTSQRGGDCPAASYALYLMSAGYRATGAPEIPWTSDRARPTDITALYGFGLTPAGLANRVARDPAYRAAAIVAMADEDVRPWLRYRFAAALRMGTASTTPEVPAADDSTDEPSGCPYAAAERALNAYRDSTIETWDEMAAGAADALADLLAALTPPRDCENCRTTTGCRCNTGNR